MVPLDDDTTGLIDRIGSPGRPMTHPKTGRPAEFILTHFGKRVSAQALRDELARACQAAGLPPGNAASASLHMGNRADQRRLLGRRRVRRVRLPGLFWMI
jgi:hypothetical protein